MTDNVTDLVPAPDEKINESGMSPLLSPDTARELVIARTTMTAGR